MVSSEAWSKHKRSYDFPSYTISIETENLIHVQNIYRTALVINVRCSQQNFSKLNLSRDHQH